MCDSLFSSYLEGLHFFHCELVRSCETGFCLLAVLQITMRWLISVTEVGVTRIVLVTIVIKYQVMSPTEDQMVVISTPQGLVMVLVNWQLLLVSLVKVE